MTETEVYVDEAEFVDSASLTEQDSETIFKQLKDEVAAKFEADLALIEPKKFTSHKPKKKMTPWHGAKLAKHPYDTFSTYQDWKLDPYGSKPNKKNDVASMVEARYSEYASNVSSAEHQVFDLLRTLKKTKDVRNSLGALLGLGFNEIVKFEGMEKIKMGDYINVDKVYDYCGCSNVGSCNKLHLNDDSKWIRINHVIYVYVGDNE